MSSDKALPSRTLKQKVMKRGSNSSPASSRTTRRFSKPPERISLLVDVSSKARGASPSSMVKLFVKRVLAPRFGVDYFFFFSGDGKKRRRRNDGDGEEKNERKSCWAAIKPKTTKFCARFYDATKTPSQMDAFVRRAISQLQKEEEEEENATTSLTTATTNASFGGGAGKKRRRGGQAKKKTKGISASSAAIGHFRSITAENAKRFLRVYEKLTEILDESDNEKMLSNVSVENRSGEMQRKRKRERFGNLAKHVMQALADMEKPDEEEENEELEDGEEEEDVDAFVTSALSDEYYNSDVETSGSDDDADERDDVIGGIAESDEDEDDDDDDEDSDEEEAQKKKYSMLIVLANMDGENDDFVDMNAHSERCKEYKIDQEVFANFRGVEVQLKRENIRAHCLRLASSYSVSNDGDNSDVREYVALFRERFGGCAARADAVTSAILSVPSCWLLNDFLSTDTDVKKSDPPAPSATRRETKEMRRTEIFVQSSDGREISLTTASSSSENHYNTGVKKIIIKACLDRDAVSFSSLDYAKTTIFNVNDGNGEGLLLALGVKNAYAACEIIADSEEEYGVIEDKEEHRIVAVLKPLTRTAFSLTPAFADESEIFQEISKEGVRDVLEQQQEEQKYRYSLELLKNAFSLLNEGGETKKLRAFEDVSRLFQLTIGGSKKTMPTTTTTHTATTTTTTTTTSLAKYCEEDDQSLDIPSSQRTTSTTFEEAKEHFDDVAMEEGDDKARVKDEMANHGREEDATEEYYSSAFAALTERITPRDTLASVPIVERLEKWYGVEMGGEKRSFTSSGTGAAATATAGMRLLASISRSAKMDKGALRSNDAITSLHLKNALDARFENEFISTSKRSLGAGDEGMVDYENPRSPEKFTRVRDQSNAFDLPKSPPSSMKRKRRSVGTPNGGPGLLSPSRSDRKKRQQTTTRGATTVNFEDEDDVVFSPKKTFKSPARKVGKSTHTTPASKKKDTKIELWTVGPEPDCFISAKRAYDEFIENKCTKPNDARDPDLGAFSRNIVKRLAVSLAKRRCVVDQTSNSKAWGEILRETKETLCLDRKELKKKFTGSMKSQENKGLKRREYLIQIHLKLTLHAMRSIKGDENPFIANMKPGTNSASGTKKTSRKQQEIKEDSFSAKETAKAVTKLVKEIFFVLGLEEGTKNLLESDVEPYYGKFCPECIAMIAHDLNVSTKLTSRYQLAAGKNKLNGKEDQSAAAKKSNLVPFSPPPKKKKAPTEQQETVGLRRSPRKLGGSGVGQANVNSTTALALVQKVQPSTSSASSAFQQQDDRKKVLNSVRSNQTRVIEQKPLSPRTKAAREKQRRHNVASRLQNSNKYDVNNINPHIHANAMIGGLNTVPKNRFARDTDGTVIGASRNVGIKPRQLTHSFSQQPLQTPLPPSKKGNIARVTVQSTPLSGQFGSGIDSTPRRVPDTHNIVESTPMQTSGGGGTGGARRRSRPPSIGAGIVDVNNNESFVIEQTPLQSNRRPKFTPASGSGRRKQELEEVVAETPPPAKHATTKSGRQVQAALDNNNSNKKKKPANRHS